MKGKKQCVSLGSGRKGITFVERIVSLSHLNVEVFQEVIMRILSPASDVLFIQKFLLSAMTSTWVGFHLPTSPGNHNSLLS